MKLLQWPCRLLTIDLGVDAEVELLSPENHATGDTIKIQIKSVESAPAVGTFGIYTSADHIRYWQRFSSPVIFCGVCLATERVFWKQITVLGDYSTSGQSQKVSFRVDEDQLKKETVNDWRQFASPPEAHRLGALISEYQNFVDETTNGAFDKETCAQYDRLFSDAKIVAKQVTDLIALMPWKISGVDLENFRSMQSSLRIRENDNSRTWKEMSSGY